MFAFKNIVIALTIAHLLIHHFDLRMRLFYDFMSGFGHPFIFVILIYIYTHCIITYNIKYMQDKIYNYIYFMYYINIIHKTYKNKYIFDMHINI